MCIRINSKYADRITPTIKKELWKRHFDESNDGVCKICTNSITKNNFTWKYIFPKVRGGRNNILNLLPVCNDCDSKYNNIEDEFNLIIYLKNKHNIILKLDSEYQQYQDSIIYYYNKAYNTGTFIGYTKPDKHLTIIPVIKYLISNNLYNPKWSLQEFCDFINIDPEFKDTDRRLNLFNITIDEIEYYEINIRYSILGAYSEKPIREMSYTIKRKSTPLLAGCFISGFLYYPKTQAGNGKYCKEIETIIEPSQYMLNY
jgi:5-methylcytosine-specific restriction protein A